MPAQPSDHEGEPLKSSPDTGTDSVDDLQDVDAEAGPADSGPRAVVAVVVAENPGPEFEETLRSFGDQDYQNLSVLVVDMASEKPLADRVAAELPDAFIHRMTGSPNFTTAANQAITLVSEAAFLLLCTDDVALEPNCVTAMVDEVYRSNAAVVTPKMVRWDDPRRLAVIGRGSDRFGVQVDLVDPDEFDQDQYDRVRDVFVAPSGATLIRADLFAELGGYDTGLGYINADLDLCWRAHSAGARVIAVPNAKIRARETHPSGQDENELRRERGRSRFRTMLVNATPFSLIRTMPLAVLLLVIEGVYSLIAGRSRQALAAFGALSSTVSGLGDIRARRRELAKIRKVSDREVAALQVGGSARLSGFFRGQFGAGQDRLAGVVGSVRSSLSGDGQEANRNGALIGAVLLFFLIFGSRHIITRGTVTVGQFLDLPSTSAMLGEWFGGWRGANTGAPGNPPTALLALGVGRLLFFWADGFFDLILAVGPLFIGALAAWRLVRPFGSLRASAVSAVLYAANPLPVTAMSAGRWDALVIWAVAPSLIGSLLRVQGAAPFGSAGGSRGPGVADRDLSIRLVRFGLLVGATATFVPVVGLIAALLAVLLAAAGIVVARPVGLARLGLAAVVALVAPVALHGPWAFDVIERFSWEWFVGPASPESTFDSLADLVRFAPGGLGPSWLIFGLLFAAGAALLLARGARFDVAAGGWIVALGAWAVPWIDRRDILSIPLPAAEIMLAPAAAGLAMAGGLAMRAIEVDVAEKPRFGWQKIAAFGTVAAIFVGGLGVVRDSLNGRWEMPTQSFGSFTEILADGVLDRSGSRGPVRVLWLAHPSVAPADTVVSDRGTHYFVTEGSRPLASSRWAIGPRGFDAQIGDRLDLAATGETDRLGTLLASHGIDLVIVMDRLAPAPYVGPVLSPDDDPSTGVVRVLPNQLDLERVTGALSLQVYRNASSSGPAVVGAGLNAVPSDPLTELGLDPNSTSRLNLVQTGAASWEGFEGVEGNIRVAVPFRNWAVETPNGTLSESDLASSNGMLTVAESIEGPFTLEYQTPITRRLAIVGQILLVALGLLLGQIRREEDPPLNATEVDA